MIGGWGYGFMTHLVRVKLISQINKKTFDATVSWELRLHFACLILKIVDGVNLTFVIWHQWTEQAFLLLPTPSLSCLCPWIWVSYEWISSNASTILFYAAVEEIAALSSRTLWLKYQNLLRYGTSTIPLRMSDGHIKT